MYDLAKFIESVASRYENNCFLKFPHKKDEIQDITYSRFLVQVKKWGSELKKKGIEPGDRVAFVTPKSPYQVCTFYACWWIGAIAVPICEDLGAMELGFIIRDSEPKLILSDKSRYDKVRENCGDIPLQQFSDLPDWDDPEIADLSAHANDSNDTAALIYTSGSTGMPKGVMLSHRNLQVNGNDAVVQIGLKPNERIISLLPYWHSFALVCELITVPAAGLTLIIAKDKRDFKRNISNYKPTIMIVVPRIADALKAGIEKKVEESSDKVKSIFEKATYNASRIFTAGPRLDGGILRMFTHHTFYDPLVFRKIRKNFGGKLRLMVSGGAPLDMDNQIFFKYLGIPMYQGYGLTESSPVISSNTATHHKLGSCGPLFPWVTEKGGGDWTFKDENGNLGKDLKGELLVKGDCVMKGYWRHTDESAKTLADGWLHTGDMGYVDDEGFLFLDGRQGNMIVLFGGEKLHPEHVEEEVKQSPLITDCMVFGEKCKNVYIAVNVNEDATQDIPEDELQTRIKAEVFERCQHLAAYQKPKDVLILPEWCVDEGTLTVTFKVRRHKVLEKYQREIEAFLEKNGEEIATRQDVEIASSKIMESLGRG